MEESQFTKQLKPSYTFICKYLGVNISEDLSWSINTSSAVRKAQQRLYYPRKLRGAQIPKRLMVNLSCAISSVLTYGFLVWLFSCTKADQQARQQVVKAAGRITGATFPEISAIYATRCLRRLHRIMRDQQRPAHHLVHLWPSGRRYRSLRARSTRLARSLYLQAVRQLNSCPPSRITHHSSLLLYMLQYHGYCLLPLSGRLCFCCLFVC